MIITKVLLLGEYSAVHRYLRDGLRELGVEVTFASGTYGWRKHAVDNSSSSKYKGIVGKVDLYLRPFYMFNRFTGHDVVQFIDYNIFVRRLGINDYLVKSIINNNTKSYLMVASCDHFVKDYYNKIKNPICKGCLTLDKKLTQCPVANASSHKRFNKLLPLYDNVIPVMHEYEQAYKNAGVGTLSHALPFPINMNHIKYQENKVLKKIVIFHGINRVGFKGTKIITAALSKIQKKYPKDVEVVIDGRVPYHDYLNLLERTNIVVDQIYNEGYGMNALISMAMGKIVVCGDVTKTVNGLNITDSIPSISVEPTEDDIFNKIEVLICQKKVIKQLGHESMVFVRNNFNHIKVAQMYLDLWSKS